LFFVSTQWLTTTNQMNLLYRYQGAGWNYDEFAESLLNAKAPTIILIRHTQDYKPHERHPFQYKNNMDLDKHQINYHFGFYCPTLWRQSSEMTGDQVVVTGDVNSALFSVVPKYKLFTPARGDGQGKFAILSKKSPNVSNQRANGS
jgi:TLD